MDNELTKVELAVDFLTVDDVELVRYSSFHVAHFEVEPLMVVVGVDVAVQYQIVLVVTNLQKHQCTASDTNGGSRRPGGHASPRWRPAY